MFQINSNCFSIFQKSQQRLLWYILPVVLSHMLAHLSAAFLCHSMAYFAKKKHNNNKKQQQRGIRLMCRCFYDGVWCPRGCRHVSQPQPVLPSTNSLNNPSNPCIQDVTHLCAHILHVFFHFFQMISTQACAHKQPITCSVVME